MSNRSRFGLTALLILVSLSASSADARFIPGLNRVGDDKGQIYRRGCMSGHEDTRSGPCRFGDIRSHRKIVLFGDSHAMQWGPALIRLARKNHWQVIALTRASCTAALVHIDRYCDAWRRNSLRRIRKMRPRPGLVVVSSAASEQAYRVVADGWRLSREDSQPHLIDGMVETLVKLRRWSKRTMVIGDPAPTPFNVTICLREHTALPGRCGFHPDRPEAWDYLQDAANRVRRVPLIDPMPMLCRRDWCHAVDHDYLVYRSQGHLSASFVDSKYGWLGHKLGDPWRGEGRPSRPIAVGLLP